jgi:hypothetical protein
MTGKGHEDQFPSTRLNAGYGFRKETIPGVRHKGRDAQVAVVEQTGSMPEKRPITSNRR